MFIALVAALAASSAVALSAYWFVSRPQTTIETRLRSLAPSSIPGARFPELHATATSAATSATRRTILIPRGLMNRTAERLASAGSPLTAQAFWGVVFTSAIGFPFVTVALFLFLRGSLSSIGLFCVFVSILIGAWAPFAWLRSKVNGRQAQLRKELPDVLDLVTLCVESGLGLDGAFGRVSEEMSGVLSDEIRKMLDEVDLGKPRREALEDFANRTKLPEVRAITAAMIQSQQLGTSLSHTLRSQTNLLRLRRRQRAEQTARQASVKMAFPLVLFLMPSLFLIVLGPIAINLFRALTK